MTPLSQGKPPVTRRQYSAELGSTGIAVPSYPSLMSELKHELLGLHFDFSSQAGAAFPMVPAAQGDGQAHTASGIASLSGLVAVPTLDTHAAPRQGPMDDLLPMSAWKGLHGTSLLARPGNA